jgi:hypothetical protein
MNLSSNKARIAAATKELTVHWENTKQHWKDTKCREFETKYIEEMIASVDTAVLVIDQLDRLISKIKSDCE